MTFSITRLVGSRALVKGTDKFGTEGSTVVATGQWDQLCAGKEHAAAIEEFDAAVEDFFKPLTEAAKKVETKLEHPEDTTSIVVIDEGEEGTPARQRRVEHLSPDSVVLRLIESNDTDRLVWVDDRLEVLAVETTVSEPAAEPTVPTEDLGGL